MKKELTLDRKEHRFLSKARALGRTLHGVKPRVEVLMTQGRFLSVIELSMLGRNTLRVKFIVIFVCLLSSIHFFYLLMIAVLRSNLL